MCVHETVKFSPFQTSWSRHVLPNVMKIDVSNPFPLLMVHFCHWSLLILRFPVLNNLFCVELCSSLQPRSNIDEQVFIKARQKKVAWQNQITTISIFVTGPCKYWNFWFHNPKALHTWPKRQWISSNFMWDFDSPLRPGSNCWLSWSEKRQDWLRFFNLINFVA